VRQQACKTQGASTKAVWWDTITPYGLSRRRRAQFRMPSERRA